MRAGSSSLFFRKSGDEDQGEGEGVETVWSRRHFVMHPYGFNFDAGSVAGQSATNAELELDANWSRVVERKRVGVAVLRSRIVANP